MHWNIGLTMQVLIPLAADKTNSSAPFLPGMIMLGIHKVESVSQCMIVPESQEPGKGRQ